MVLWFGAAQAGEVEQLVAVTEAELAVAEAAVARSGDTVVWAEALVEELKSVTLTSTRETVDDDERASLEAQALLILPYARAWSSDVALDGVLLARGGTWAVTLPATIRDAGVDAPVVELPHMCPSLNAGSVDISTASGASTAISNIQTCLLGLETDLDQLADGLDQVDTARMDLETAFGPLPPAETCGDRPLRARDLARAEVFAAELDAVTTLWEQVSADVVVLDNIVRDAWSSDPSDAERARLQQQADAVLDRIDRAVEAARFDGTPLAQGQAWTLVLSDEAHAAGVQDLGLTPIDLRTSVLLPGRPLVTTPALANQAVSDVDASLDFLGTFEPRLDFLTRRLLETEGVLETRCAE